MKNENVKKMAGEYKEYDDGVRGEIGLLQKRLKQLKKEFHHNPDYARIGDLKKVFSLVEEANDFIIGHIELEI